MYVELCYNISTSKYEKSNSIINIPRYRTYLLICCVLHLKNIDTVPNAPLINEFLEK